MSGIFAPIVALIGAAAVLWRRLELIVFQYHTVHPGTGKVSGVSS